jgi:hypothetical protein
MLVNKEIKGVGEAEKMDEKSKRLMAKLERFLSRACQAEQRENYLKASRCFLFAVYCEAHLRNVVGVYEYTRSVLPVY